MRKTFNLFWHSLAKKIHKNCMETKSIPFISM
uniref:Uncharacterized protein n=1 Tax=Anguilla anguilla TaxID=7936 RepID=A0A0E9UTI7_ANGAN